MSSSSSSSKKKKLVVPPDADEEHCPKRLRFSDPDCIVIVGDQTFYHYRAVLSYGSEYFDAMLGSDMKEGRTRTVEFPDKDADEWRRVYKYFEPTETDLTEEDLSVLVPWFSELRMTGGLSRCDNILKEVILKHKDGPDIRTYGNMRRTERKKGIDRVKTILEKVEFSILYDLPCSMKEGLALLKSLLEQKLFFFDDTALRCVVSILKDEAPRNYLLPSIKKQLPHNVPDMPPEELVNNPLLEGMLLLKSNSDFSKER